MTNERLLQEVRDNLKSAAMLISGMSSSMAQVVDEIRSVRPSKNMDRQKKFLEEIHVESIDVLRRLELGDDDKK